ncbi:MAG: hypothetical protein AAFW98_08595 [Pseudomonadota bacterium]
MGASRHVVLDAPAYHALLPEYRRRLLAHAVKIAGGGVYEARGRTVITMDKELGAGARTHGGGARAIPLDGKILLVREPRNIAPVRLASGSKAPFDNRFLAISAPGAPDCEVRTLAGSSIGVMPEVVHPLVIQTAPFVFVNGTPVAAPTLGMRRKDWPPEAVRFVPLERV